MTKQQLRKHYLALRDAIAPQAIIEKSYTIHNQILSLPLYQEAQFVLCYLHFRSEVHTHSITKDALQQGKKVAVPVVDFSRNVLQLVQIHSLDFEQDYIKNKYGIFEPKIRQYLSPKLIDCMLVPGAVFDVTGARIGYGGGYYDKLLCESTCMTVGLAFDFQLLPVLPEEPHDKKMDILVTEERVVITCSPLAR
ncbi:MAG: 5-formyltetrahydrofolate cyclo-ligase [Hyphomonadaceae bacterium]|nr:5-formyltetrahydrofolate cyclo-ligase [Clostridia bacterium]